VIWDWGFNGRGGSAPKPGGRDKNFREPRVICGGTGTFGAADEKRTVFRREGEGEERGSGLSFSSILTGAEGKDPGGR